MIVHNHYATIQRLHNIFQTIFETEKYQKEATIEVGIHNEGREKLIGTLVLKTDPYPAKRVRIYNVHLEQFAKVLEAMLSDGAQINQTKLALLAKACKSDPKFKTVQGH